MTDWNLPNQPAFTLDEVAELTGLSKRSLQAACRKGDIWHLHHGRKRTLTREQLEVFLAQIEVKPVSPPVVDPVQLLIEQHRKKTARRLASKNSRPRPVRRAA